MEPNGESKNLSSILRNSAVPLLSLLVVILVVAAFLAQVLSSRNKTVDQRTTPQVSETLKGKMKVALTPSGGAGSTVRLSITASSSSMPITGFDIVFRYNHNNLQLRDVEPKLIGYRIIETDKQVTTEESELIITAIQDIGQEQKSVLADSELAQVVFSQLNSVPLSQSIKLIFTPGKIDDANLIDSNTEDILGSVEVSL